MATDLGVSERIYLEIRRRLMAGAFRLRERLDVARLAAEMGASATPVREALTRLAAERLIALKPTRGFFANLWSADELRALYQWRSALVLEAVREQQTIEATNVAQPTYAERVASLLQALERGANAELRRAARNADDRLHAARRIEPDVIAGSEAELTSLEAAFGIESKARMLARLKAYHARRIDSAGALRERAVLRALPPNGE